MANKKNSQVNQLSEYTSQSKLSVTLASAFKDDPIMTYPFGKSIPRNVEKRSESLYGSILKYAATKNTAIHYSADENSVAIWYYDDSWSDKTEQLGILFSIMKMYRWNMFKFLKIFETVQKHHPKEPHIYLYIIGTHDNCKGKGLGGSVISKMLQQCDEEGLPAYLESSNKKNIPFYERYGFVVQQVIPGLPNDCPPLTAMWREPRKSD